MKPFDINLAKQGHPVCTLDGRDVRIVCFDANNEIYPLIGLVNYYNQEIPESFTNDGFMVDVEIENKDLFMKSEKKKVYCVVTKNKVYFLPVDADIYSSIIFEEKEKAEKYISKVKDLEHRQIVELEIEI